MSTNEYSGMRRLHLHDIGLEVAEDLPEEGRKKGERIESSVSLTPLCDHLDKPGCDALYEALGGRSTREVADSSACLV